MLTKYIYAMIPHTLKKITPRFVRVLDRRMVIAPFSF